MYMYECMHTCMWLYVYVAMYGSELYSYFSYLYAEHSNNNQLYHESTDLSSASSGQEISATKACYHQISMHTLDAT